MSLLVRIERRLTSQPGTSFMISASRARAARKRRYASRSPSAKRSGTRCKRLHTFSRCSSLCIPCGRVITAYTDKRVTMSSRAQQKPAHLIRAREAAEDAMSESGICKGKGKRRQYQSNRHIFGMRMQQRGEMYSKKSTNFIWNAGQVR